VSLLVSRAAHFYKLLHTFRHGTGCAYMYAMNAQMLRLAGFLLPTTRTHALVLLALFVCVQIADGCLTAFGIDRFGMAAEANPLIALGLVVVGPAVALTFAKGVAVAGAVMLYRLSRHSTLAVLTVMYMVMAIMPWAWALTIA
jgi:hypothetical protein